MMALTDEQKSTIMHIQVKLTQLGHDVTYIDPVSVGPLITTYRFAPRNAAKVAQISAAAPDLALALAVEDVTIRRIPGEAVIGISVPNKTRTIPLWRDHLQDSDGNLAKLRVPLSLGVDALGNAFREDLATLPHLLIAGSTGGGKTVLLRSLIASLCYWRSPSDVQLVLSDTKQVEFGTFDGDPHLWRLRTKSPIQTCEYMDDLIRETERRLKVLEVARVQNVSEYNTMFERRLPYLVLVIDELADFMGKSAVKGITKLAESKLQLIVQRARAAGVHVIAATQRPSVDVVTGIIKSNFSARLTFRLPSEVDSRTIIGHGGAEHLMSRGDMFYVSPLAPSYRRLHSLYATTDDITQCVDFARSMHNVNHLGTPVQNRVTH
jgi:S-DNA-T family DNA segregation ATPase FtsK/SpoIIIE